MKAMLVYQAGIANVFEVDCFNLGDYGRNARRMYQGDFYGARQFARGLGYAGAKVMTAACNKAGDISSQQWTDDLDSQPFSDKLTPIAFNLNKHDDGDGVPLLTPLDERFDTSAD